MARGLRLVFAGVPVHVVQRGNNRVSCFSCDDDYRTYLAILRQAAAHTQCAVHAYVLMTNHVHLLVTPREASGVSQLMQRLGRRYVRAYNERHGRTGTLWEGRFRSSSIDSERYLLTCQRYIELNPVRAGLVREPGAYRWSSHRYYADGHPDPLLTAHDCVVQLVGNADRMRDAYRDLFRTDVSDEALECIRRAVHRGRPLGQPLTRAKALVDNSARRLDHAAL